MVLKIFTKDPEYPPGHLIGGYSVLKRMGEGRYGICYLVSAEENQYILKLLKKHLFKKIQTKSDYEEEILKKVRHPSIPRFIKRLDHGECPGYLLEFKAGKTFEEIIFDEGRVFDRADIFNIGLQLIDILKYLHARGIVHRDIRVPNTLYDDGRVNLVDFGLARWINDKRYTADVDFSYLGDFLLHLYYTSYETKDQKSKPWYEELDLTPNELFFFKRLMGLEERYKDITEVERDFLKADY